MLPWDWRFFVVSYFTGGDLQVSHHDGCRFVMRCQQNGSHLLICSRPAANVTARRRSECRELRYKAIMVGNELVRGMGFACLSTKHKSIEESVIALRS